MLIPSSTPTISETATTDIPPPIDLPDRANLAQQQEAQPSLAELTSVLDGPESQKMPDTSRAQCLRCPSSKGLAGFLIFIQVLEMLFLFSHSHVL